MAESAERGSEKLHIPESRQRSFLEDAIGHSRNDPIWWLLITAAIVSISLALFHIFVAAFGTPESRAFRSTHLTGMLVLVVLIKPLWRSSAGLQISDGKQSVDVQRLSFLALDGLFLFLVLAIQAYTLYDLEAFQQREGNLNSTDVIAGSTLVLLVLEATRRMVGLPMVIITIFFLLHALSANHFPGLFFGPPVSYERLIDVLFVRADGIFGVPLMVAATYIVLFIVFGAMLVRSGAGRFFLDLAVALTGHRRGGPAKASVVASAFLGTVSGSAVANVATTGAFTIPLMKKIGYGSRFSAAVEACASSGGQITPPIMGAAAFIIAEYLRVSYVTVLAAAIIPTILYFATVYMMVDLEADKHCVPRIEKSRLPELKSVLRSGWHQLFTLVVLVALLAAGFTAMIAAFGGIVAVFLLSFVNAHTRLRPVDLLAAFEIGIRNAVPVTVACACAGLIIGSIFASGLGLKFTNSVIELSGGSLFLLLVLTALASIILGMGMTTTAVYITVAALVAPALVQMGVEPMAAHLFAFYYGVVSTITPPVALAAFAAAGIAGSAPMRTAFTSARVGVAKYVVPFAFVFNSSLLLSGALSLSLVSFAATLAALWSLSVALEGWYNGRQYGPGLRVGLGVIAVALLLPPTEIILTVPGYYFWLAALAGLGLFIWSTRKPRRETAI
ncbi:MAG: TRAP transporter permease [Candidatus Rariloculaceae bacterium]